MSVLNLFRLEGRVAIVTGASAGLGAIFAETLAAAGADLVIGARRADRLEDVRRRIEAMGRRCVAVTTDVTKVADCDRLISEAVGQLGGAHILVNNAGMGTVAPAHREAAEHFDRVIGVNLAGAYYMCQAFARACIAAEHGGSIVNVASIMGLAGSDIPQAGYSASKAGMIGMTRDLAMQWSARRGIRVNALAPAFFHSELTEPLLADEAALGQVLRRTPLGRIGEPHELSGALLLLASDAGSYITGITLPVDGGWTLH